MLDLLGYTPEEVVGKSVLEFLTPADFKRFARLEGDAAAETAIFERNDYTCVRKDGSIVIMEANGSPRYNAEGALEGFRGITRDVTGRKAVEEGLRRHARQMEALRLLGLELTAELDLDSLLRAVVSRALELLEAGSGGMYFHRRDTDVIEWKIGVGPIQPPPGSRLRKGEGLPGRVWESGQSLAVCEHVQWDGDFSGAVSERPMLASMGASMRWGGEFFGVLYVIGSKTSLFSAGELKLLDLLASSAAIAIRNARLYEAATSRAERLSVVNRIASAVSAPLSLDELLETVYRETVALFMPDAFFIALHDEKSREIELRFRVDEGLKIPPETIPVGDGFTSRVIADKKPLSIHDIPKEEAGLPPARREGKRLLRSWLGVPMLLEHRVIGVISLQSYRVGAFDADDVELLCTVAEQVGAAVERARLYQSIRDSEEKHRTLFEQAMDAVILQGADGRILDVNQRACELLGYRREELLYRMAAEIAAPGSPLGAALQPGADLPDSRIESEYVRKDGSRVPVEASLAFLTVGGKPMMSVVAHDISQRRRVEAHLRQAQKMDAVGTLAGGVAHDFNNILTGILGYASLLRQEVDPDNPIHADVDAIAASARRAAELTKQLLTFSRRSPQSEMEPVDLSVIIREIEFLLSRTVEKSITVKIELEARSHTVEGNAGQLHQALLNLCLNARDAMPSGGVLSIRTGLTPPRGRERAGRLFIRVSDTGVGMPQKVRDRLFEPFFTTKENGRGLGLAMVYGIVRAHGGEISVQTEPDAGTTFEFNLPLSRRTVVQGASAEKSPRPRGSETILVVDDEPMVRSVLRRILEHEGYTVVLAEDGVEGVEKYRTGAAEFGLVILDMAMPRMDGSRAFEALKAADPSVKVLISSGYSEEGRAAELISKGAKGFLHKPYASETVLARVREILDA